MDVKTVDPGVKAELDSESEDEVLMATSIPLKEELLSRDRNSDDQACIMEMNYRCTNGIDQKSNIYIKSQKSFQNENKRM